MEDGDGFAVATVNPRVPILAGGLILLAVLATWLFGHLPWVLDGFRVHDDARGSATGLASVRLSIPLIAGQLTSLVAFTAIGSIGATLLPLAFPDLPRALAVVLSGLTLAVTTLILTLTARSSISTHAADAFAGDERVLDGLVAGVLLVTAAAGFLGCLASFQIGLLPLATAVVVGQLPVWFGALGADADLTRLLSRLGALVLLAAAFVISVRRSAGWIVLWPVALAIVWIATPLRIATSGMQDRLRPGAGLNEDNLSDVFAHGRELFRVSFWEAPQAWWPGVVAAGIAVVWLLVVRRRTLPHR
ncbi:hypothetical protein EFK50_10730 [Nocardioides marmoriginsengisoli]|uniref:Uncharacterized protein n=1 Tax=Nocardioides marmoriginsengisoli TaxID=661483 RepID=A0A3N0CGV6_9ACTN|nr:hypothetical protein [Nocardioides marmoriginsengisoli]RNL62253.1 hypothetical protein EFK50_10730 [Nocardioides marmoriginsengisoli]